MNHSKRTGILAFVLSLALPAMAPAATLIDFSEQKAYTKITGPLVYPSASFTSSTGTLYIDTEAFGLSPISKGLCGYDPTQSSCVGDVLVSFTEAVNNLKFIYQGDNTPGSVTKVDFVSDGVAKQLSYLNDGLYDTSTSVNLSTFKNITSLKLSTNDNFGLAYDNFSFDIGKISSAVPEPSSWALMLAGFGAIGLGLRRRRVAPLLV